VTQFLPAARAKWVVAFVVAIGALVTFCGHPGKHSAGRQGRGRASLPNCAPRSPAIAATRAERRLPSG
jgi:hypothetical protein